MNRNIDVFKFVRNIKQVPRNSICNDIELDEWFLDVGTATIGCTPTMGGRPKAMSRWPYAAVRPDSGMSSTDQHCRIESRSHVTAAIDGLGLSKFGLCGVSAGVVEMFADDVTQALNGLSLHPADHANSVSQKRIPPEKQQIDAMNRSTTPFTSFNGPFDALDWDASESVFDENGLQILSVDDCVHDTSCSLLLPGDDYMDTVRQQLSNCWILRAQALNQFMIGVKQLRDRGEQGPFEIIHPMLDGMYRSDWMNPGEAFIARPFKEERVRNAQTIPSVLTGKRTTKAPGWFSELARYGAVVEEGFDLDRLRLGLPCKPNISSISRTQSLTEFELHDGCIDGNVCVGAPQAMSLSGAKLAELQRLHDEIADDLREGTGDAPSSAQPLEVLVEQVREEASHLPNSHIPIDPLLHKPRPSIEFLTRNNGCLLSSKPRIMSLEVSQWKWQEHFNSREDVMGRCRPTDPTKGYSLRSAGRIVHNMFRVRGSQMNNVPVNELAHVYYLVTAQSKQQPVNAMANVDPIESPQFCGPVEIKRVFDQSCFRMKSTCRTRCQLTEAGLFKLLREVAETDVVDILNACWAWGILRYDDWWIYSRILHGAITS